LKACFTKKIRATAGSADRISSLIRAPAVSHEMKILKTAVDDIVLLEGRVMQLRDKVSSSLMLTDALESEGPIHM